MNLNNSGAGHQLTSTGRLAACLKRHGVQLVFGQSLPSAPILALRDPGTVQIFYRAGNATTTLADGSTASCGRTGYASRVIRRIYG